MKKKLFVVEYFLEGLIIAAAATNYIPPLLFLLLFAAFLAAVYWWDGMQQSTLYYIPIALCMLAGQAMDVPNISAYTIMAVVYVQYAETPVYHLPQNKKIVGFRKRTLDGEDEEYFEFYPIVENTATIKRSILWNQGRAFQKIIDSKQEKGIVLAYHRLSLSYIKRMPIAVGEGEQKPTKNGMALCHGRDAAPLWYSSLLVHFASNGFKVGARQHANLTRLNVEDKETMKKRREQQAKRTADQYYSVIAGLKCDQLVLVGHSFGCSALLQAYHDHNSELSSKVTHIILLDPYFFPLPDALLVKTVGCPVLVLSNQYLLGFEDVHERFRIFTSKKNVTGVVWKEGSDLYQTDLCFFLSNGKIQDWESKFQVNLDAINAFMQAKPVQKATFGDKDLGKEYKPEQYFPEHLFIF